MFPIAKRSTIPALLFLPLALAACGGEDQPGAMGTEGAHEHGVARVNVAVEGSTATIEFVSPAMGIYGFEHEAVSEEDRARQAEGLETLRTRFASMFVMEEGLGCTFTPVHVGMVGDDHAHGEGEEHAHTEGEEHAHDEEHAHAHEDEHAHDHEDEHAHEHEDEHAHAEGEDHAHEEATAAATPAQTTAEESHDHDHDHAHSEVTAEFTVSCTSPLAGSRLTLAVADVFPGIQSLDLQVLGDQVTGGRYQASGTGVDL